MSPPASVSMMSIHSGEGNGRQIFKFKSEDDVNVIEPRVITQFIFQARYKGHMSSAISYMGRLAMAVAVAVSSCMRKPFMLIESIAGDR